MSGHSKWHNIQARKGKQDSLRANVFTKVAKAITIAAQHGGDPTVNFSLRLAIDKAKAVGMPKDNIDRAVKRGTGELSDGVKMEELYYEGFGPGGVAILIKTVTDNRNRTLPELKHIMSKYGGSIGGAGSVQWMFGQVGLLVISKQQIVNRDEFELMMIEAGADDIFEEDDNIEIKTKTENFQKVLNKIKEMNVKLERAGVEWVAKDKVEVSSEVADQLEKIFEALEDHDDVEEYYTNAG
jgi:YebC/PmpR family DNA-binding regulatory protein